MILLHLKVDDRLLNGIKYVQYAFLAFIIVLSLLVIFNYSAIQGELVSYIIFYGYFAIFIFSLISDMVPQPVGPELPIIAGILLGFNAVYVVIIACIGSMIASTLDYLFGKSIGARGFKKIYGKKKYTHWKKKFRKYSKITLVLGAWTPAPYEITCWAAGTFGMKKLDFFLYGIISRTLQLSTIAYITKSFFM